MRMMDTNRWTTWHAVSWMICLHSTMITFKARSSFWLQIAECQKRLIIYVTHTHTAIWYQFHPVSQDLAQFLNSFLEMGEVCETVNRQPSRGMDSRRTFVFGCRSPDDPWQETENSELILLGWTAVEIVIICYGKGRTYEKTIRHRVLDRSNRHKDAHPHIPRLPWTVAFCCNIRK